LRTVDRHAKQTSAATSCDDSMSTPLDRMLG